MCQNFISLRIKYFKTQDCNVLDSQNSRVKYLKIKNLRCNISTFRSSWVGQVTLSTWIPQHQLSTTANLYTWHIMIIYLVITIKTNKSWVCEWEQNSIVLVIHFYVYAHWVQDIWMKIITRKDSIIIWSNKKRTILGTKRKKKRKISNPENIASYIVRSKTQTKDFCRRNVRKLARETTDGAHMHHAFSDETNRQPYD